MEILQDPHPSLRKVAEPIPEKDIPKKNIQTLIARLKKALEEQGDGVAIAAPQIGAPVRIFVISSRVFRESGKESVVCINPELIRLGKERKWQQEGCLSVRWKYGKVKRATTASIRAKNASGHEFVLRGKGLLAQIFQHEIDHLNGVLFTDHAKDVEEIPPA